MFGSFIRPVLDSPRGDHDDTLAAGKLNGNLSAFGSSRMLEQDVWAEVKVGSEHLRLFSEQSAQAVRCICV